jgi:hypothetical protein
MRLAQLLLLLLLLQLLLLLLLPTVNRTAAGFTGSIFSSPQLKNFTSGGPPCCGERSCWKGCPWGGG